MLRNVLGPEIVKHFTLDEALMPVMADPTQLELAVLNLAINARDAMPGGGTLHFATHIVKVADDPEMADGESVEVAIRDSGTGMSPDVVARAFEPFFTTKDVGKGTGLGLDIARRIVVERHGGLIGVDSPVDAGRGTAMRVTLPPKPRS
jgi:signal transduction histidine kinase